MPVDFITHRELKTLLGSFHKRIRAKQDKLNTNTQTLSADLTLKVSDTEIQFIDPGGSNRVVYLPACYFLNGSEWMEKSPRNMTFIIYNTADASEDLTVKYKKRYYTSDPPVFQSETTHDVIVISQDEGGICNTSGVEWIGFMGGKT